MQLVASAIGESQFFKSAVAIVNDAYTYCHGSHLRTEALRLMQEQHGERSIKLLRLAAVIFGPFLSTLSLPTLI